MSIVTKLLQSAVAGDRQSTLDLFPLVYEELRRIAHNQLRQESSGQTLQPTALVHEAYLRLVGPDGEGPNWDTRGHFFTAAAEAMRRILVDNARRKKSLKRGGDQDRVNLDLNEIAVRDVQEDIMALDEAMEKLASHDPESAKLVQLRYFGGLTLQEIGLVMKISPRTADRLWAYARAWLKDAIQTNE